MPAVPLPRKRMPPKVRAFRKKMNERNLQKQDLVAKHLHAAQAGSLAPGTPAEAAVPPFPPIPGLSELKLNLDSQSANEDKVATRWTIYAIHSGPVAGIPPTNLEISVTGMTLSRLTEDEDGVASQESFFDQPALLHQLKIGS